MKRIHIFADGVGYYKNLKERCRVPISKDEGPVCITTFPLEKREDIKVLVYYLKFVIEELKERFAREAEDVQTEAIDNEGN